MPICVAVLEKSGDASELRHKLKTSKIPISRFELVHPLLKNNSQQNSKPLADKDFKENSEDLIIKSKSIESIKLLNPKLSRQSRQIAMALWLMPFGFVAGLTFSQMTGLQTFEKLGFGSFGELIIGGILGMGSGWIGSYAAAGSVNPDKENDLRTLRKFNEEGKWLLLIETPIEIDLPWELLQKINPIQILNIRDQ